MKKTMQLLFLVVFVFSIVGCGADEEVKQTKKDSKMKLSFELSDQEFKSARHKFTTKIVDTSFEPDGEPAIPPQGIFDLIYYPAEKGDMAAYLTPNPNDGKRHPAVIWVHGGYGGIGDWFWESQDPKNDQSGRAIREAGIVMMAPSFRGENANPGNYEMFFGEIYDLESAREYLASLPYVDPNRIYLMGHSTGGTTVLLSNEYSTGFRAAFSLGGVPDLGLRIKYGGGKMAVAIPFDQKDPKELELRSPRTYLASLNSPTFYFEGSKDYWPEFDELKKIAKERDIPFYAYSISNGDHFTIITPTTQMIAKKILEDTGEKVNIQFSEEDLKWIWKNK